MDDSRYPVTCLCGNSVGIHSNQTCVNCKRTFTFHKNGHIAGFYQVGGYCERSYDTDGGISSIGGRAGGR